MREGIVQMSIGTGLLEGGIRQRIHIHQEEEEEEKDFGFLI